MALLRKLGVQGKEVSLPYVLHTNKYGESEFYTPPGSSLYKKLDNSLERRFADDFKRYDAMVGVCQTLNTFFAMGDSSPSFYKMSGVSSYANPLNFISNRTFSRWCGISNEFYEEIVKPFHGFQFTTIHIDEIPAVAMAALDDIGRNQYYGGR